MPMHPLTRQRVRRELTSLRRDLAAHKATLVAVRELHAHVEALRSVPLAGGDPIANRVRNSYLDDELERLARQAREFEISVGQVWAEIVGIEEYAAEAAAR